MTEETRGPNDLYTEDELCKAFQCKIHTLRRERRCGKLRSTMVGGRVRFTQAHVDEYLQLGETACPNKNIVESESSTSSPPTRKIEPTASVGSRRSASIDRQSAFQLASELTKKPRGGRCRSTP